MSTFENGGDPDKMQHNAAFHQGLHPLLHFIRVFTVCKDKKNIFRQKNTIFFIKIIT